LITISVIDGNYSLMLHRHINIKNVLIRTFLPYGAWRRVLRGPAKGMKFMVEPGMGLSYLIGSSAAAPRFFANHIQPGSTVFDVGANKGQMSLIFASLVGDRGGVISFEPAPREFTSLKRNIVANDLNHVHCVESAAGAIEGSANFVYYPALPTQGGFRHLERAEISCAAEELSVAIMPLDKMLLTGAAPDVIKIDVEGSASEVLQGAKEILKSARPKIYIELHNSQESSALNSILKPLGYRFQTQEGKVIDDPTLQYHYSLWCLPCTD